MAVFVHRSTRPTTPNIRFGLSDFRGVNFLTAALDLKPALASECQGLDLPQGDGPQTTSLGPLCTHRSNQGAIRVVGAHRGRGTTFPYLAYLHVKKGKYMRIVMMTAIAVAALSVAACGHKDNDSAEAVNQSANAAAEASNAAVAANEAANASMNAMASGNEQTKEAAGDAAAAAGKNAEEAGEAAKKAGAKAKDAAH